MGGANSRLNAAEGGGGVPDKIRPILSRRLEEFRKKKNGEGTLSKKQLLKGDGTCHETDTGDKVLPKENQLAKEEKLSRVAPLPNSECETEEDNKGNLEVDNIQMYHEQKKVIHVDEKKAEAEVKIEEEPKTENEQKLDAKIDDDDDDGSREVGGYLYPGSPSFRIYYIEAEKKKKEECKKQTIAMHKKSHSIDSVASAATMNVVPQVVEIESTTKRKGNKIRKFGAMKTLLKVKSCYHPMCTCTGENRSRLIVAKATN